MKTQSFRLIPLLLLMILLPMDASALTFDVEAFESFKQWFFTVFFIAVVIALVPGGGQFLLVTVGLIFSPLIILGLIVQGIVDVLDKPARTKEKKALVEAESDVREALDDWLAEVIVNAEIAVCTAPQNTANQEQLARLKEAKRLNNQRLIELHEQFDTVEIEGNTVQIVENDWATLKSSLHLA